jgi:hypothetical protein
MVAAEAAQQALLTSGKLAERAQENPYLKGILVTYLDLQRLYHKAMLPHVQRHQQLSGTPAGLAYAMLCGVLSQPLAKQVGDQITYIELQQLVEQVQQLPSLQAQHTVAHLAIEITAALETVPAKLWTWPDEVCRSTIEVCVMQDVIGMLVGEPVGSPAAAASPAGGLSGMWKSAVSQAGQFARDTERAMRRTNMEDDLLQAWPLGNPLMHHLLITRDPSNALRCDASGVLCAEYLLYSVNERQPFLGVSIANSICTCVHTPVLSTP